MTPVRYISLHVSVHEELLTRENKFETIRRNQDKINCG